MKQLRFDLATGRLLANDQPTGWSIRVCEDPKGFYVICYRRKPHTWTSSFTGALECAIHQHKRMKETRS